MNLNPVLNAKTVLAFGSEWVHVFCVHQAVLQKFFLFFFIKLCTHESVQDGNVCSIYCLGTVVPTPEICAIVWHILRNSGKDKIFKNTTRIDLWGFKATKSNTQRSAAKQRWIYEITSD